MSYMLAAPPATRAHPDAFLVVRSTVPDAIARRKHLFQHFQQRCLRLPAGFLVPSPTLAPHLSSPSLSPPQRFHHNGSGKW